MTPHDASRLSRRPDWGAEHLDLDVYLTRIGLPEASIPDRTASSRPTLHDLRTLHRAHLASIPFDSIDFVLGTPVSLEPAALVDKLCRRPRGGCCHEHNLLFALVLERCGLTVERLAARVRLGGRGPRPHTHMLLKTRIGQEEWLCDVGFGSDGYLDPLPARDGAKSHQHGRCFRVRAHDHFRWSIDVEDHRPWARLYEFTHEPLQPMDITVAHHFLASHPRSMLRQSLFLQLLRADRWLQLRGNTVERRTPSGSAIEQVTSRNLGPVLAEFGIELTEAELSTLADTYDRPRPPAL
ncbi:arylamine N-acetyltransferase [Streptomyces longwoodensis]|uniref:arylamine N-acetyltransferase family protein n=1 Tax=Streptomyces longwoodensis TaxID=68231 RepID=UPI00340B16A6